ncbi:group II intron reverse transcriptase/maturase [Novosphingobium decolorationis]|jgi:RNA-directed DNA polymerase|uniref:Group II intron reverse transcriptase/maturase n=1 Tax=Novosphingobium decolorationis TaxID=2698673 RepID=A0ABX8E4U3_9SPHN|nr:group II intron reverse transcriptase/maturase [Novosphingobium decolorationis]QVM84212.1 group II intron reverse transcriptase/maturase [Novosphingobium decolorationis]
MGVERQQGSGKQQDFFDEALKASLGHDVTGKGGTGAGTIEERQSPTAWAEPLALTRYVMEEVASSANLNQAYKRVKANKGAPGVDGMTVPDLRDWIAGNRERLIASLLDGTYRPSLVRGVEIPKPGGKGVRQLGIPTAVDRLVQQAILQVLDPVLDPTFSASSFGFRPGRGAHDALRQARDYVRDGYAIVVDLDLEKFFDRVNHDIVMARLARHIADPRLLVIIRRFLQAGMLSGGVHVERQEGTPQGGPLSPLIANLILDDLDKELERRGHRFCRYADDCNIYVRSQAAGERVMASVTALLEGKLRLRVNQAKSAVAHVRERTFLGHRLTAGGFLSIANKSLTRLKERLRAITRRNRGISLAAMIAQTNAFTTGWVTYYRHARAQTVLREIDSWLRRKLRCVRLKQCKRTMTIATFLRENGVPEWQAWIFALSGKGWWRLSGSPQAAHGMPNAWFDQAGLSSLALQHAALNRTGNRRDTQYVRPVV